MWLEKWLVRHPAVNSLFVLAILAVAGVAGWSSLRHAAAADRRHALIAFAITGPVTFALFVAYWAWLARRGRLELNPDRQLKTARRAAGPGVFIGAVVLVATQSSGPVVGGLLAGLCAGVMLGAIVCRSLLSLGIGRTASERRARERRW